MSLTDETIAILEDRGFDIELIVALGVESCNPRTGGRPPWISIPYRRNGETINHKYRAIGDRNRGFSQDEGTEAIFWNWDALADDTLADQPLVVTEGEADCWAAMQAGYQRAVSVPNGAPPEAGGGAETPRYRFIKNAPALLNKAKEIILAVDNDGPGVNLLYDLGQILGRPRCKWVSYPKGCKDLADVLRHHGGEEVKRCLVQARWMRVEGIYRMHELPPLPVAKCYDPGIIGLGQHYKLRPGDFAVVTGVPSSGKSTVMNDIACRMISNHGWSVAFASFEQTPQRDHRRALRTWFTGKLEIHQSPEELDRADAWINRNFVFVVPNEDDAVTMPWLLERLDAAVIQYGVKMVVVDPFNEMDHTRLRDELLTEYVGNAIKAFRKFAQRHMVHFVLVAHPTKPQKDGSGKVPMPTLYDISDSAHFYNKADVGIVVHRADEHTSIIRIAKSRYHSEIGTPGDLLVSFDLSTGRYTPTTATL